MFELSLLRTRRYQIEWLLLGLLLLVLGALIGYVLYDQRAEIGARERDRLQVQARVIEENLGRQLEGANNALVGIREALPQWDARTIGSAASPQLKVLSAAMPGVRAIGIFDAEGTTLASSREELIGSTVARDREFFKIPKAQPDRDVLYVSPPFKSVLGVYSVNVVRAVIGPAGEFTGIIAATLDPGYFDVVLRSVLYAPDMLTGLVHGDGRAFLYEPPNEQALGKDLGVPGSNFTRHRDSGQTTNVFTGPIYSTGEERLTVLRNVNPAELHMDKPLVVGVSRRYWDIYASWRTDAFRYSAACGIFALIAILSLYMSQQRRRSFDRAAAAHEEEQRESAERLELAAEAAGLGIFEYDLATGGLTWDATMFALHGASPATFSLRYEAWRDCMLPEDRADVDAAFENAIKADRQLSVQYRIRRGDGEVRTIRSLAQTRRDQAGRPIKVVGVSEDITEHERHESEILAARNQLQATLDAIPDLMFEVGLDGRFHDYRSPRGVPLFVPPEEFLGKKISEVLPPDAAEAAMSALKEASETGRSTGKEFELPLPQGRCWFELSVSRKAGNSGQEPRFIVLSRDITDRKRAEAARMDLEGQLRESQKMEALGTLAGGIAHDFNNIVAAILGNAELARQDLGPSHKALVSLEEIGKASRRAKALVQQILAFGRRQAVTRKVITLAPVVADAERLLRATLPAGLSLNVACAADAPPVLADATQVEQVLLNLCSNAGHAVQGLARPGVIEVRLDAYVHAPGAERESQPMSMHDELRPGRYTCLTVRDNGQGMDEETAARIFEPFFTTKPVGEGTGLGLAVVHSIVREHEASIEVHSEVGEGTTFRICFPATDAPVAAAAQQRRDSQELRTAKDETLAREGEGRHVLYVDDDEAIIFLMTRLLERRGYRVSGYTDASKALAAVRDDPSRFDLAVTDFAMPGMSGLHVASALREIRADLPVAIASGYITEELRVRAPAAGVSELIYKPNSVDDLCDAVARLVDTLRAKRNP